MKKGLLLGNGINNRIGIKSLSVAEIQDRFIANVIVYKPLLEKSLGIYLKDDEMMNIFPNSKNIGIETLAGLVYKYIREKIGDKWCVNADIRIQDLLTCIAITTIFLNSNGKMAVKYDKTMLPNFREYDVVLTLNYYEFWDENNISIPLHGKVNLNAIGDDINLIVSRPRMEADDYRKVVEQLSEKYKVQIANLDEIVFAPSGIDKDHLICVEGLYPSNCLYPMQDLFIPKRKTLYQELQKVDQIDVLGMSPNGDEAIINLINSKQKVRIFVYNRNENDESNIWESKLTGDFEILDSKEI